MHASAALPSPDGFRSTPPRRSNSKIQAKRESTALITAGVAPLTYLRALQRGPVQLYLLYVLVTLLLLLVWQVAS